MKRTGRYWAKASNFLDTSKLAHLLVANGDEGARWRRKKAFEFKVRVFPNSTCPKCRALGWRKIKYNRSDPLTDEHQIVRDIFILRVDHFSQGFLRVLCGQKL